VKHALLIALALAAAPAVAADRQANDQEIVVEAPRSLPTPPERSPYSGAPVVVTTVRISALYGDLDLSTARGVSRLRTRIGRVAQDACRQLDRIHPFAPDPDCVAKALARTEPALQRAIDTAAQTPSKDQAR
jgi:UrcA family protein